MDAFDGLVGPSRDNLRMEKTAVKARIVFVLNSLPYEQPGDLISIQVALPAALDAPINMLISLVPRWKRPCFFVTPFATREV